VCGVPDIDIDAGRFQTLTTMINAENLPNQTHYREVLSQIVSPNSAFAEASPLREVSRMHTPS